MRPQIHIPMRAPIWRPGWDEETYERSRIVVPPEYRRLPRLASYTLIAHTIKQTATGNDVTTTAIDTTGADLIVLACCTFNSALTPTDSQSNAWTGLTDQTIGGVHTRLLYKQAPSTSATHTWTITSSAGFPVIGVLAFSGSVSSPFDQENGAVSASASSLSSGNVTPGENNEVIVSAFADAWVGTASVSPGSLTITDQLPLASGVAFALAMAYEIQTTATTRAATWSVSVAARSEAVIATFKAAAGGGGVVGSYYYRQVAGMAGGM